MIKLHLKFQLLPSCPHLLLPSGQLGRQLLLPTRQLFTYVWHGGDVFLMGNVFDGYFWYWFRHSTAHLSIFRRFLEDKIIGLSEIRIEN